MRLISATVRSYRLHRDLTVKFDPYRNLIVGLNESGKSTLVEAIHRALFLKASFTGAIVSEMRSRLHAGAPEVELRFAVGGETYHLVKRFAGPSGSAILTRDGGEIWQGAEAEEQLSALLGVEPTGGGRGIERRLQAQWAHLWVWQGQGGEDPAEHAAAQQQRLLQQLQRVGGAVALQSALDGRVAERFAELHEEIFTRGGKPKASSALATAAAECEQAREAFRQAEERLERLELAMRSFAEAEEILERSQRALVDARREAEEVAGKLEKLAELRRQEEARRRELEEIEARLAALEESEQRIRQHEKRVEELQKELEPLQKKLEAREEALARLRSREEQARAELEEARRRARRARGLRDLAAAGERLLEAAQQQQALADRVQTIEEHEAGLRKLRQELGRLPAVDARRLKSLERRERELGEARAALEVTAPQLELLAAAGPVQVGERPLEPGERIPITETAELVAGDLRLRIHPGGGESLAELRARVERLSAKIREALDQRGLATIDEAAAVLGRREEIEQQIARQESALEALDPQGTRERLEEANQRLTAAEATLERLREAVEDAEPLPEDPAAARVRLQREQRRAAEAEREEEAAAAAVATLGKQLEELVGERDRLVRTIGETQREQDRLEAAIAVLVEQAGDESGRARKREALLAARGAAEERLAAILAAITELQPELLEADQERIARVVRQLEEAIRSAEQQRAGAQALLQRDGTADPRAELAEARARLQAAEESYQAEKRRADAVALVHQLFQAQQRRLAEQFSRPLAEMITTYLRPVFGPQARAEAVFEGHRFTGVKLIRPGVPGAFSFADLSGGTREQIAAAVRLAMAELLAAGHDRALPVVFDDAFANSDPRRIELLQRTLDLGARRGLQIIVLSCHEAHYTFLGAHTIRLAPPIGEPAAPAGPRAAPS